MTDFQDLDPHQEEAARLVAEMPYAPPPPELSAGVMQRIGVPRRPTLLQRMLNWFVTPQNLRITPWVPALGFACLLLFLLGSTQSHWQMLLSHDRAEVPGVDKQLQTSLPANAAVAVVFSLHVQDAKKVALIGSFNDWQKQGVQLQPSGGEGWWTVSLPLKQGRYEYAFVIDGTRVVPDPDSLLYKEDGFGNLNSVIIVEDHAKMPLSSLQGA